MPKKNYCSGCHDNFYNGQNQYGIKVCWHLKDARVVSKKEVHINQMPPFTQKPIKVLSCYHKPQFVYLDPKRTI